MSADKSPKDARRRSNTRFSSDLSSDEEGSLYPGDERLLDSMESAGSSLWHQYSLINKSVQSQTKPDLCLCCDTAAFRHTTLKAIFVLVVGFGLLISSLALRYSTYTNSNLKLVGGDQILMPVSTYFNKEILFKERNKKPIDSLLLYLLPDVPSISHERVVYSDAVRFLLPSWSYQYWGLNLLAGSELTISICTDLQLQFYILKGDIKLKAWKQTTLFYRYDFQTSIRPQKDCQSKGNFKSHLMRVSHSDVYYLLFSSSVGWRFLTEITVILNFNRTSYDVSRYKEKCQLGSNKSTCQTELTYSSKDIVLLQAASNLSHPVCTFYNFDVDFVPLPRLSFYLKLFGSIYVTVILITLVYSIWRCFARIYSSKKSNDQEKEPLLSNAIPYSYSMNSTAGENPWLVISPRGSRMEERDNDSVMDDDLSDGDDGRPRPNRHPAMSVTSTESVESLFKRSRDQSSRDEMLRRQRQYLDDQQLLDSVMTSAGVSAI